MKRKLLTFIVIGVLVGGVWWGATTHGHRKLLQQSQDRLGFVEDHLMNGNLKAANSLLIQLDVDLKSIDRFYTWRAIQRSRSDLCSRWSALHQQFRNHLDMVKTALDQAEQLVRAGKIAAVQRAARKALRETASDDATLMALAAYAERLEAQDFKGAEERIASVTANLPEELNVREVGNMLTRFVRREREANYKAQKAIATAVRGIVDLRSMRESSSFMPVLKGRAMVWDFTKESIDQAYELLPDDLRASSRDGVVTMFCILKRKNIEIGRYSISGQPAYQEKMTIGVVYWPQKTTPGTAIVWGGRPPAVRPVKYSPEYGSAVKIKEWVERLARE